MVAVPSAAASYSGVRDLAAQGGFRAFLLTCDSHSGAERPIVARAGVAARSRDHCSFTASRESHSLNARSAKPWRLGRGNNTGPGFNGRVQARYICLCAITHDIDAKRNLPPCL